MIDAPAIMIVAGSAIQAAPAVQKILAALRPRSRAQEVVASLPFTPLPASNAALDALLGQIP
jgi:hypothetical protein